MTGDKTQDQCADHEDYVGQKCPGCGEEVDAYGNTAYDFRHCSFPDCGCDGARLCMAGNPSDSAMHMNVEAMWSGKTRAQRKAVFSLVADVCKEKADG